MVPRRMNIVYDQKLIDYMQRKNYCAIVIEQIDPIGCCADTSELLLRFVNKKGAEQLRDQAIRQLDVPFGELFIMVRGLDYDEQIVFGLRSFLGLKDITVKGIRHWKL